MKECQIVIVDFGGQYAQLIARRVREMGVYCEILPWDTDITRIRDKKPKGILFSGGPSSVTSPDAPMPSSGIWNLGVPILGICYGAQLMAVTFDGAVGATKAREYGSTMVGITADTPLFAGISKKTEVWMSHTDSVTRLPNEFSGTAASDTTVNAAFECAARKLYAVQFHPEVVHTKEGKRILENFLFTLCGIVKDWDMGGFATEKISEIREHIGGAEAICGLSGGVDSTVAAAMVHKAIGERLTCIFVDHGLLRQGESDEVMKRFAEDFGLRVFRVDASALFLGKLKGVTDPERKRKIIGSLFIKVFEREARKLKNASFLVQGTIYPDVVESGTATSATIKSHHNVGGLPERMKLSLIEPLRELFKDEVRKVGLELGLPEDIVHRQPFPGPGLAIRIIGEITAERLRIVRESDAILREEIAKAGLNRKVWQYFTVLPGVQSVGVMGDERTYSHLLAIRAVESVDGMTSEWFRFPEDVLARISLRIVNEVRGVNRIVYDVTSKPPATIEWE